MPRESAAFLYGKNGCFAYAILCGGEKASAPPNSRIISICPLKLSLAFFSHV